MTTKRSSLDKWKTFSDGREKMQEEMNNRTKDKCMYKLNEYLLYVSTTTRSCLWGLKVHRIKMHENYCIKEKIRKSQWIKEF